MQQTMFGPYRIEDLLGRGGMGEVYRAYDTETDRRVALKLLPGHLAADSEYEERFRRECRVAASLSDPHVVPIHRFGEIDGRLYMDMRLVEGTDLGAWLRDHGPMPADVAVAVIGQVARALDAAHAAGLVHRDVKPSNVLLANAGADLDASSVFAYLFDFGIARARDGAPGSDQAALTRAGTMPGSLAYIAPERFSGVEGDPRADVYALACVLYQALTGRPPFEGNMTTLMRAHLMTPPPRPGAVRAGLPAGLDEVVAHGMEKEPDQRYSTAGALATAARAALAGTSGSYGRMPQPQHEPQTQEVPPGGWSTPRQPQPAHSFPEWSGPGVPQQVPPAGGGRRATYIAVGLAVTAVVVGVAVVLGLVSRGNGTRPETTSSAPRPPSSSSVAPPSSSVVPPDPEAERLLVSLPKGFGPDNCTAEPAEEYGATAIVFCDSGPADGPESAFFGRYASVEQMEAIFTELADQASVPAQQGKLESCQTATSVRTVWIPGTDLPSVGSIACYTDPATGVAHLIWTDERSLAVGYLERADGNAAVLFEWWRISDVAP